VEVKIGIQHASRELIVDTSEDLETIEKKVAVAVQEEGGVLTLTDTRGRRVVVPGDRIAYVEIGTGVVGQVGFRS
jgi:hypothetical protein